MESPEAEAPGDLLELRVDGVRGSPGAARSVEDTLRAIPGVVSATADPRTGSVAILYEPHPTPERMVTGSPRSDGERREGEEHSLDTRAPVASLATRIVETVVVVGLEVALQRALGPLFWPRRS